MGRYIDWEQERKDRYDAARNDLEEALKKCATIAYEDTYGPEDAPFIQGWVAIAEFTNIALEQSDAGARVTVSPQGQTLSTGMGLAAWSVTTYE